MPERIAVIVAPDLLGRVRLEEAARAAGVPSRSYARLPEPPDEPPSLVVVDLEGPAAIGPLRAWRDRWSDLRIVAVVSHVDEDLRRLVEALGCEVLTRGTAARRGADIFRPLE